MLAHGDGEFAQIAGVEAVDLRDDDAVVRDRGEFAGAAHRQLRPQRLDLVLQGLDLVELALNAREQVVGRRADEAGGIGDQLLVALQQRHAGRRR